MTNELHNRALRAASKYMERRGCEILQTAWSCEAGTIDLIAKDEDALVFTCVKCHDGADEGLPADGINAESRDKYERLAAKFLSSFRNPTCAFASTSSACWSSAPTAPSSAIT